MTVDGVADWVCVTEGGRVLARGEMFRAADGALVVMPGPMVDAFVDRPRPLRPLAAPVLVAVARALFGWLP